MSHIVDGYEWHEVDRELGVGGWYWGVDLDGARPDPALAPDAAP